MRSRVVATQSPSAPRAIAVASGCVVREKYGTRGELANTTKVQIAEVSPHRRRTKRKSPAAPARAKSKERARQGVTKSPTGNPLRRR